MLHPVDHYPLTLAVASTLAVACLVVAGDLPVLPPGLSFPLEPRIELPDPFRQEPSCTTCADRKGELRMHHKHFVSHQLPLDTYAPRWTGRLLVFEHGFQENWTPATAARLYASGPQGQGDIVQVIMRNRHVLFQQTEGEDGKVGMRCISHEDFRLARRGRRIVVEQLRQQRWLFATPDYGVTWRLERLEPCAYPTFGVELLYETSENKPSALVYPDGARAEFAYDEDFLTRVELPNGYVVKLTRDEFGWPVTLERFAPSDETPKQTLSSWTIRGTRDGAQQTLTYRRQSGPFLVSMGLVVYETDHLGRIHRFTNACGREFAIDYDQAPVPDGKGEVYTTKVTDLTAKTYRFLRHKARGKTWVVERLRGEIGDELAEAEVDERQVFQKRQFAMVPTELMLGNKTVAARKLPRKPTKQERLSLNRLMAEAFHADYPPRSRRSAGKTFVYEYADRGLPSVVHEGENRYRISFDALGRIRKLASPSGQINEWAYDKRGLLIRRTVHIPKRDGSIRALELRFAYDGQQRLVGRTDWSGREERLEYGCRGIKRYEDGQGNETLFAYNARGELVRRIAKGQKEFFAYHPNGRLKTRLRQVGGQQYRLDYTFDHYGRTLTAIGIDPEFPGDDRGVAHEVRRYVSPSKYTNEYYNARGLLIRTRGTNDDNRDLFYSESGRLIQAMTVDSES